MHYPPGEEAYSDGKLSVFEIDGTDLYCRSLFYLSELFNDGRQRVDIHSSRFYVLYKPDDAGFQFIGYFLKVISLHIIVICSVC